MDDNVKKASNIVDSIFSGRPRDPARIDAMLDLLRLVWKQQPDTRLGQLISNASCPSDVFTIEDGPLMEALRKFASPQT